MNSQSHLPASIFGGLDVHKDRTHIAAADAGPDGELRRLVWAGQRPRVVYGAGPCGFALQRHLTAAACAASSA